MIELRRRPSLTASVYCCAGIAGPRFWSNTTSTRTEVILALEQWRMKLTLYNVVNKRNARWRHKMETPLAWLALLRRINRWPADSPYNGKWCGSSMYALILPKISCWTNCQVPRSVEAPSRPFGVMVILCLKCDTFDMISREMGINT